MIEDNYNYDYYYEGAILKISSWETNENYITNCTFRNNRGDKDGSVHITRAKHFEITNCLFEYNSAK